MKRQLFLLAILSIFPITAFANEEIVFPISEAAIDLDDLKEVRITSTDVPALTVSQVNALALDGVIPGWSGVASQGLGALIGVGEGLVTFGAKIFELIKNSRGVSTLEYGSPITVLPQVHANDPTAAFNVMENWKDPKMKSFTVEFKNWRNAVAVSFSYLVSFQHGGQYEGKGAYLQGVAVSPGPNSQVGPLWSVDAAAQYLGSTNSGSRDNPVAGLRLIVNYTVHRKALGREYKGSHVIFVKGDGRVEKLQDSQDPVDSN